MTSAVASPAPPSLLDEIDVVTLEGVLADIDACQFDICDVLSDESSHDDDDDDSLSKETTNSVSSRGPTAGPYSQRYDTARRLEVRRLRSQVKELQAVLDQARRYEGSSVRSPWFRVATEQRRLRAEAEEEQRQLRLLTHNFWGSAAKIERLMERVERLRSVLPRGIVGGGNIGAFRGPVADPAIQFKRVDGLARRADKIFSTGVFAGTRRSFQELQFFCSSPGQPSMDIVFSTAWELPFPVEIAADAFWRQLKQQLSKKKKLIASLVVYADARSSISQFVTHNSETCDKHGHIATRRYPNADGRGVLIVSSAQVHAFTGDQFTGFIGGDNWIRVVQVPSVTGPRSRVQWYCHARLEPEMPISSRQGKWIQSIMANLNTKRERKLEKTIQALENLATDETIARRNGYQSRGD